MNRRTVYPVLHQLGLHQVPEGHHPARRRSLLWIFHILPRSWKVLSVALPHASVSVRYHFAHVPLIRRAERALQSIKCQ